MGLGEMAGHHPRAQLHLARVGDVLPGRQPQEVRRARAVGAGDRHPLAVEDLQRERLHQPRQLQLLAGDGPHPGPPALKTHPDVLLARRLGRRPDLLELPQPGPRRLVPGGHVVAARGVLLQVLHQPLQLGVLLVPAAAQLLEPGEPLLPRLVEGARSRLGAPTPRSRPVPAPPRRRARRHGRAAPGRARRTALSCRSGRAGPPATVCPVRPGSCRARPAAAPRQGRAAAPPAPAACAHRPTGCAPRAPAP